jgi:hypothetical protein
MPRTPLLVLLFRVLLVGVVLTISLPGAMAHAQDPEAPSQELSTDPEPPTPLGAATVDPLGMAFGEWTARFELALVPAHAILVEVGYRDTSLSPGITVELGYHLYPLGEGVDGPFVGPSVGFAITTDRAEVSAFGALEAGWQLVLGPFALGIAGGIEAHLSFDQSTVVELAPRLSVTLGYAFR